MSALVEAVLRSVPPALKPIGVEFGSLPAFRSGFVEAHLGSGRVDLLLATRDRAAWVGEDGFLGAFARDELGDAGLVLVELDAGEPAGVHACVDPEFPEHGWRLRPDAPPQDPAAVRAVAAGMGRCLGLEPPDFGPALRPPRGRVLHLSAMPQRPGQPWKLNAVLPGGELGGWLTDLGWPGRVADLLALADRFCAGMPEVKVDLGFAGGPVPRIGLEVAFPGPPATDPRWRRSLDRMEADRLMSPAQREAVEAWEGEVEVPMAGRAWPAVLGRDLELKVVLDGEIEAKAYLAFQLRGPLLRPPAATAPTAAMLDEVAAWLPDRGVEAELPRELHSLCLELRLAGGPTDLLACAPAAGSGLPAAVPLTWLEFDGGAVPAAGRYLALGPLGRRARRPELVALLDELAPELPRHDVLPLLDALPDGGILNHLGEFRGRAGAAPRVALELPADELVGFLRRIVWTGDLGPVVELEPLWSDVDRLGVALDLGRPTLGLELVFFDEEDPRWTQLLAALEARGLARPEALEALRSWPGASLRGQTALRRRVHHVKLSFADRVTAKSYLWVHPG